MSDILKRYKLESICKWKAGGNWHYGWNDSGRIYLGGRLKPYSFGLYDAQQHDCPLLDKMRSVLRMHIEYFDEEVDPLRWCDDTKASECTTVYRIWEYGREFFKSPDKIQHIVLGPNLIKETAWNNTRRNVECNAPVPNRHYAWENPDKVQKIIKKPKELTFKMAEGGDMVFCTIPSVKKFNMSNPDGQDKLYHKVTLTKPYWITKYCVTTKQWREYAKYDCEGFVREVERYFPKNPIYMPFTRMQWEGFCSYLNRRYGHQLPKGYVFRLPTEAEWEWAFVGDKDGDLRKMPYERFNNCATRFKAAFEQVLKKNHLPESLHPSLEGYFDIKPRIYVGGRTDCTDTFGVCDMYVWFSDGGIQELVLDTYDSDGIENADHSINWFSGGEIGKRDCQYADFEVDPFRFAGRLSSRVLKRKTGPGRLLEPIQYSAFAHIVVGPDIEAQFRKKELEQYSEKDFGGRLLSDMITLGSLSSRRNDGENSAEDFKRMISTKNTFTLVFEENKAMDSFGFQTQSEESPWIQLNLSNKFLVTGLQIDALSNTCYNRSRHLRVWTSEDGKSWREVAAENQRKHRYRFDLQRKNVKAKYIRIGREPGFLKDCFSLDKILVYGKEK